MDEREKLKREISAVSFIKNNGLVLTTINILTPKYSKLVSIESVFKTRGISKTELIESVNFLAEEKYIHLRLVASREEVSLADTDYDLIEAKLSGKGLRLLSGGIEDNMIEV